MRRPEGHPVLAAILDTAMAPLAPMRDRVVPRAEGRVLEVGVGTGLNLERYDPALVDEVVAVDPDPHMLRRARPRAEAARVPVTLVEAGAEALPFPDGAFDSVVITFTLCTVPELDGVLAEVFRVLRAGGVVHFAEHDRADGATQAALQRWIDPVWCRVAGGCHLDRQPVDALRRAGFVLDEVHDHGRGPLSLTPIHRGVARRPG